MVIVSLISEEVWVVLLTILAIIIQSYSKIIFEIVLYFLSNESSMLSVTKIRHSLSLCYRLQNSIKRVQESIIIKVYMPSWGETYPHVSAVFQFFDSIHLNSDLAVLCVKRSIYIQ
jgi:hypothetical protein